MKKAILTAVILLAAGALWAAAPARPKNLRFSGASQPAPGLFLNGFFPICAFQQPSNLFSTWKARGVNTMATSAFPNPAAQWEQAAKNAGLRTIRPPLDNPADDIGNTNLLAWAQFDEPDASGAGYYNLYVNHPTCIEKYNQWKAIDPTRPVYLNLAGPNVLIAGPDPDPSSYGTDPWCSPSPPSGSPYPFNCDLISNELAYVNSTLDWVANDIYPVSGWLPNESRRYDLTYLADPIERIRTWTDKPQFCHIETDPIYHRGVTPDELRAQIWIGIVHGVRGIIYFPDSFDSNGNWTGYDGTPADVAAEMTTQNAIITSLAPVLQGDINPAGLGISVPAPLQAAWRNAPSGTYFIVVNPVATVKSNATITLTGTSGATTATVFNETPNRLITLGGGGTTITDSFTAFAVHVYVVH